MLFIVVLEVENEHGGRKKGARVRGDIRNKSFPVEFERVFSTSS
jgi:hypothetical protein